MLTMLYHFTYSPILEGDIIRNISKTELAKYLGFKEAYTLGVNVLFGPRRTNRPNKKPNYGPKNVKLEVDYYIQKYCSPEKLSHITTKMGKKLISNLFF